MIGFNWNPNPTCANNDEWGGDYGKCCGHNEPCLQFVRPFYPQVVINTRICSKEDPAPGNQGFEGCLEFLISQCSFYYHPITVWDTQSFHYIDHEGKHSEVKKQSLLVLPEAKLSIYMTNLRQFTLDCAGKISPRQLLLQIKDLYHLAEGNCTLELKNNSIISLPLQVTRLICSFLMKQLPPVSAMAQEMEVERLQKTKRSTVKKASRKIKTNYIVIDDIKIKI